VTVILFCVRVPVLSEQMTVTEPRVSTAGSLRMSALRLTMRWAPMASEKVWTAGSPSGTIATAMAMAMISTSAQVLPSMRRPVRATTAATARAMMASVLPSRSSFFCSGVCSCTTLWIMVAILPSSVRMPVSTTRASPRP
jgi:hypothetical protein